MTQMESARAGKITEEMEKVALFEGIEPEVIRQRVAEGSVVIPKNIHRDREKICGIGKGLNVKINGLMGTSSDRNDMQMEAEKLRLIERTGADAFMDLSTGDDIDAMRKQSIEISNIAAGCVPVYQASVEAIERHGAMVGMTKKELLDTIEKQCADGIDFMAVHSALNWSVLNALKKQGRVCDVVSRGGSFLTAWMFHNQKENPLYEYFDDVLKILKAHDTVLSIGDAIRPGAGADSLDAAQVQGLIVAGELSKRALEAGVQVMIEGPGHVPMNQIATTMQLQKQLCHGVPYYILGFLATDVAPGYDNITGAIGGAFAGLHGADFLCYLTPAEHVGLPNEEDVVTGIRSAKIAADCVNVMRHRKAYEDSFGVAAARVCRDDEREIRHSLIPDVLREKKAQEAARHIGCSGHERTLMDVAAEYYGIA